ncbi:PREDICTED: uncharacterized protein LOC106314947 [Brassica oleracea var. oleracea]|uniref:uncharacterized protein LOC106314947 n=1 Tax=Brassica oleracea var. oleracea TaxID=109376 RepID=UPI0006A70914|nr:PREDICTED: uncharacterized protein LOC106314947 [Brassica oleracea var. oleracea]
MYNNIVEYQPTLPRRRVYIERNHEEGHNSLWKDYFSAEPTYPPHYFRRRFRMNHTLFTGIVNRLSNEVPYFQHRRDAVGRYMISPLQKCTAAIRMLAYGCAGDMVDEYLRMGETTALLCLKNLLKESYIYMERSIYEDPHQRIFNDYLISERYVVFLG